MELVPVYLVLIPVVASMLVYLTHDDYSNAIVFLSQIVVSVLAVRYFRFLEALGEDHVLTLGDWSPAIGISLRNDRLSMAFIFLALLLWWSILLYVWRKRGRDSKFMFFLVFLEGIYMGLLQTSDLFNFFVFVELITIVSTILILYQKDGESVRAGLYYLLFNSMGILFYLVGMAMVYNAADTLNIAYLTERLPEIGNPGFLRTAYVFMMAAVGVKSAFFPVFNWLPKAHSAAPSSISALLSGLLVKSGLYVFIRMNAMFGYGGLDGFFLGLGLFTALTGVFFALSQKDMKRILAFHTVSQVGIILIGLTVPDPAWRIGGTLHIFNHAFFKSLLFLGAGAIIKTYRKRSVTEIRGVLRTMPFESVVMVIGMLSITGAPLFSGFVSKTLIKKGLEAMPAAGLALRLVNIGTMISFIKMSRIFFGVGHNDPVPWGGLAAKAGLLLPGVVSVALGVLHVPLVRLVLGADIGFVDPLKGEYWAAYGINALIGFVLYKLVVEKDYGFIKKARRVNISFGNSNYLLILYIVLMLIWR